MDTTPNLALPYIAAAQAQKHVTHNEAIRALDALVQLSVIDRDLTVPPSVPVNGERYIIPAAASGAWAGHTGKIAAYQDGAWAIYPMAEGWVAWVADEDILVVWNGSDWSPLSGGGGVVTVNPAPLVGVNVTADATNKLAVKSDAVLLSHDDVTPGSGDMRQVLNKAAIGNTVSQLYQSNWSGRAETGLTGNDDFHVKVSSDGTSWKEAIVVDRASGNVTFPNTPGLSGSGEANTSSNVGSGAGLAKAKTGIDLPFKSLVAGANVTITPGANEITIAASGGGSGESNTASNVNTGGVGVFKQKMGTNLEFRGVNAGSSKVTVVLDGANNEIDIDVAEANLTLSNLGGAIDLGGAKVSGTLAAARFNDTAHGDRSGGALHTVATTSVNGFMSAADKSKLDGVASGANSYAHPNHSGDVTSVGDGATTITNNAVTNAKLADMAAQTFKGRTAAGAGDPEDLTVAQATALLDTFTSGAKGLTPASGGGAANFLRADGTWALPPGASGGEANTASNAGAGTGIAKAKVGVDLPFKSLVAGSNITITPGIDEITISAGAGVPAGAVQSFAMSTPPAGWLKANGALVSRTTYANLFSAIGTIFGAGDGSTTFALPDLRGEFIRGWDDARGVDTGRVFGSAQAQAVQKLPLDCSTSGFNMIVGDGGGPPLNVQTGPYLKYSALSTFSVGSGTETRPRNVALLACIKY